MFKDLVELTIEKVVAGGEGLARWNGRVVFVPRTLPGERVLVSIINRKKDFARAKVESILQSHPQRIEAACPHFAACGGCDWQHAPIELQLEMKLSIVKELWARTLRQPLPPLDLVAGSAWQYRSRVQIHSVAGRNGFIGRDGRSLESVPDCQVVVPALQVLLKTEGALSAAAGERQVWMAGESTLVGPNDKTGVVNVNGQMIRFAAGGFFQSNLDGLSRLGTWLRAQLTALGPQPWTLLDLYGGVGTFSVLLAGLWSSTTIVESDASLVDLARLNLAGTAAQFFAGRVEDWKAKTKADCVIVDPPREGLSPAVRAWLTAKLPAWLVYVSCDPVTQVRDLVELFAAGYQVAFGGLFDFYPQTAHIETCLVLRRQDGGEASS